MDDYVCLTLVSHPGEMRADFSLRLSHFWTHLLRTRPDDFEMVYAETTAFEQDGDRCSRQYLVRPEVVDLLERELVAAGLDHKPIDRDEVFSKYEAKAGEWMQIEH